MVTPGTWSGLVPGPASPAGTAVVPPFGLRAGGAAVPAQLFFRFFRTPSSRAVRRLRGPLASWRRTRCPPGKPPRLDRAYDQSSFSRLARGPRKPLRPWATFTPTMPAQVMNSPAAPACTAPIAESGIAAIMVKPAKP